MTGCSFDAGKKVFYGQVSAATTAQGAGCYEVRDLELLTAHVKTIIQSHRRSQCCTLAVHQKMLDWSAARLDDAVKRAERERAAQQKNPFIMAVSGGGSKRSSDAANSALCKKPKVQRGIFRLCRGRPEFYAIMWLLADHNLAPRVILSSESFANVLKCARLVGANFRPAKRPAFSVQNGRLGKWL
jgi:hypothetical protein